MPFTHVCNENSSRLKQYHQFHNAPPVQSFVPFALVVTVGGVGIEDITIPCFQSLRNTALFDGFRTAIIGKHAQYQTVSSADTVHGTELSQILTEQGVCLLLRQPDTFSVRFSGLHDMSVSDCRPMLRTM